jgi:hypothetical protein
MDHIDPVGREPSVAATRNTPAYTYVTMSPPQQPTPPSIIMGQGCGSGGGDQEAEARINLALLEPQRWGWTAAGGIADLLPPHEVSVHVHYYYAAG